jgi:hypothetical protein
MASITVKTVTKEFVNEWKSKFGIEPPSKRLQRSWSATRIDDEAKQSCYDTKFVDTDPMSRVVECVIENHFFLFPFFLTFFLSQAVPAAHSIDVHMH